MGMGLNMAMRKGMGVLGPCGSAWRAPARAYTIPRHEPRAHATDSAQPRRREHRG